MKDCQNWMPNLLFVVFILDPPIINMHCITRNKTETKRSSHAMTYSHRKQINILPECLNMLEKCLQFCSTSVWACQHNVSMNCACGEWLMTAWASPLGFVFLLSLSLSLSWSNVLCSEKSHVTHALSVSQLEPVITYAIEFPETWYLTGLVVMRKLKGRSFKKKKLLITYWWTGA